MAFSPKEFNAPIEAQPRIGGMKYVIVKPERIYHVYMIRINDFIRISKIE